jgi:hypothetical protein
MQRKPPADQLIGVAEAARILGLNRSTLSRQVKLGLVRAHRGKVRLSEVRADRRNNLDMSRRVRYAALQDDDSTSSSFAEARAKKEQYLAQLRELEYAVKSGRLVDAEIVRRRVFELARSDRDALMNWPTQVAPLIAAEFGVDQVRLAVCLEAHVRQYLSERADVRGSISSVEDRRRARSCLQIQRLKKRVRSSKFAALDQIIQMQPDEHAARIKSWKLLSSRNNLRVSPTTSQSTLFSPLRPGLPRP